MMRGIAEPAERNRKHWPLTPDPSPPIMLRAHSGRLAGERGGGEVELGTNFPGVSLRSPVRRAALNPRL